ncbi:MAG TPA: hypothetical protein VF426_11985 [Marmoricola sp.]
MSVDQSERPSWLEETCPPWCAREHHEHDHAEDRVHGSEPVYVPVVRRSSTIPGRAETEAGELIVQRLKIVGDRESLVLVTDPEDAAKGLILNNPSAERLRSALEEVLQ